MSTRKLCTLFNLILLWQITTAYKTFNKTRLMSSEKWNKIDLQSSKGRMYYVDCTDVLRNDCTVLVEEKTHSNDSYSCNLSSRYMKDIKLQGTLGSDKTVLVWKELGKSQFIFKFGVLHLKDCRLIVATSDEEILIKPSMFVYEDYFDVIFDTSKLCDKQACKVSFNDEGKVIKASATRYIQGFDEPIATDASDDSILYHSGMDFMYMASNYYLRQSDERKKLATIGGAVRGVKVTSSTSYNYTSICETSDDFIRCLQFDDSGNLKFKTVLEANKKDVADVLFVENLADGGLLLALEECFNCRAKNTFMTSPLAYKYMYHYLSLGKIDAYGKIVGSKIIDDYGGGHVDLYEDEDGNYCMMNSFSEKYSIFWPEKKLNFVYKCFNDTDLSEHSL